MAEPMTITIDPQRQQQIEEDKSRREAFRALMEQRERAMKGETPDMSMEEIIEEIKLIRAERRQKDGKQ